MKFTKVVGEKLERDVEALRSSTLGALGEVRRDLADLELRLVRRRDAEKRLWTYAGVAILVLVALELARAARWLWGWVLG